MTVADLIDLMDRTWPAHATHAAGGWVVREGRGGGFRVSSASVAGNIGRAVATIPEAEAMHRSLGQVPCFRLIPADGSADAALAERGYRMVEETVLRAAPVAEVAAAGPDPMTSFPLWPPLAVTELIWDNCGIGADRRAIMELAEGPKTVILGRADDRAGGAVFVGTDGDTAMIHALHVLPDLRRRGLARNLVRAAAAWAASQNLRQIGLAVTRTNLGANALYDSLAMPVIGGYHYRTP